MPRRRTLPECPSRERTSLELLLGLGVLLSLLAGCEPGSVGNPCVAEDEYRTNFSGYSASEVNIENRSFQCESRVCLVNHFQGRASCPYGQSADALSLDPAHAARCRVPGTDGSRPEDAIEVPVNPWLVERTPNDAVYCSCRCAGPDENARYCECPSGYACEELVADLNLDQRERLAGSYCVKEGTQYKGKPTQNCRDNPSADCPEPHGVNP